MIDTQLGGKVAMVTGANHGIGAAPARAFAAQGARVFLTHYREPCEFTAEELHPAKEEGLGGVLPYRSNQQQTAEPIVEEIRPSGDVAASGETDLSVSDNIPELFARCERELGKYGITVNIVAPGPTQTGYIAPANETAIAADTPLGRIGRPQDVSDVIVFLASEQARWLTGQLLHVGGGWRMHQ